MTKHIFMMSLQIDDFDERMSRANMDLVHRLANEIKRNGQTTPIKIDHKYRLIDGFHRCLALYRLERVLVIAEIVVPS